NGASATLASQTIALLPRVADFGLTTNESEPMRVSVAVPAYNEERNIGLLIDSLRSQKTRRAEIAEIVVVASGCTDRTAEIVRERQKRRGTPVRLIVEPTRR